jgi:hypothetical protein
MQGLTDDAGTGTSSTGYQPNLNHETFTLVGYGTEVRKSDTGPQTPIPQNYPIVRRYTDEFGQKLTLGGRGGLRAPRASGAQGGSCLADRRNPHAPRNSSTRPWSV